MIKSMTAFARKQSKKAEGVLVWEIRSVNNRYLDMTFRLPEFFRELEPLLRLRVSKQLERGKVDCILKFQPGLASKNDFTLNEGMLENLSQAVKRVKLQFDDQGVVNMLDVLRFPGVMQGREDDFSSLHQAIIALFEEALIELNLARERECHSLSGFIEERLQKIEKEIEKAREHLPVILESNRDRLLTRLMELKTEYDDARLEQEMVLLAQKLDVSEEIDRLNTHVNEVRRVLKKGGVVGRRLDFLMQELNREANTLGSKSMHELTSYVSVELKVLIEQIREQVQNFE